MKAPRRTIAAVAAVTTALMQPVTVAASKANGPGAASGSQDVEADSCLQLAQQLCEARAVKRRLRRQRKRGKAAATVCEDKDGSSGQTNPARGITPRRAMPPLERASSGDTLEGKRQREVAQSFTVDGGGG